MGLCKYDEFPVAKGRDNFQLMDFNSNFKLLFLLEVEWDFEKNDLFSTLSVGAVGEV